MKSLSQHIQESFKIGKNKMANTTYFKDICVRYGGILLENDHSSKYSNKYTFDVQDANKAISDSRRYRFDYVYNFNENKYKNYKCDTLCVIEYTNESGNKFDEIEEELKKFGEFKEYDNTLCVRGFVTSDIHYTAKNIMYKNQEGEYIYLLKFDYGYNYPYDKYQYYIIFDYYLNF